ncbi:MAG: hypothetical protein ACI33P_03215 [Lysinibacillus sp.]
MKQIDRNQHDHHVGAMGIAGIVAVMITANKSIELKHVKHEICVSIHSIKRLKECAWSWKQALLEMKNENEKLIWM